MIVPLCWMIITSLRASESDIMDYSSLFPAPQPNLVERDIRKPELLVRTLVEARTSKKNSAVRHIWLQLNAKDRQELISISQTQGELDYFQKETLLEILNTLLSSSQIYTPDLFPLHKLSPQAQAVLCKGKLNDSGNTVVCVSKLGRNEICRLNRCIFEMVFPENILHASSITLDNYKVVLTETNFARALFNSVFITICITAGQLITSSLAAFAFARLKFFGRDKIFLGYLATLMVPISVTMIPTFILLRYMGWIDTYAALILPGIFSVYGTFLLRQFFMGLPTELEEAAVLDGCGTFRIYWHVALPLSKPAMAALGILTLMGSWRTFMWPLIVAHTPEHFTLPVALTKFQGIFETAWTFLMAGGVIMIIPLLLVFFFGQRFFVSGIRVGAVKG